MIIKFGYPFCTCYVLITACLSVNSIANEDDEQRAATVLVQNTTNVTFASCHNQLHETILASSYIFEGSKDARRPTRQLNSSEGDEIPARVAHCIVGSARTLWHPHAYKSIQNNFIEALGGSYNTFMYLKLEDSKELFPVTKLNKNRRPTYNARLEELNDAIAYLNPTKVVIAPEKPVEVYLKQFSGCSLVGFHDNNIENLVGQIDTLRDCFRLVEEYESSEGMRFDWVTRIRPDTAIVRPVVPVRTLDSRFFYLSSQAYVDHIGIFSRNLATHFFTFSDKFFSQCPEGILDWRTSRGIDNIQAFMFEHPPFVGKRIFTPIPVVIIRAEEKAMTDKCQIFVNHYHSVYGKGAEAISKCKLDTQTDRISLMYSNVSIPYRFPSKNASTSFSKLFQEDCLSLFTGNQISTPLRPYTRNITLQDSAQTSKVTREKKKKKPSKSKVTNKKLKTIKKPQKKANGHKGTHL